MARGSLPEHVRGLLRRDAYPHATQRVELTQTHISYVLFAGEHVFKLKKPLDLGFLDFTTLAKRRQACEAEVRLNQRGCPGTYLGVEAVTRQNGRYRIGGDGEIADYAVHMRRLPAAAMMDRLLAADAVGTEMIGRLVARLADMHREAERGERINAVGGYETVAANWRESFDQVAPYAGRTLSRRRLEQIQSYAEGFLRAEEQLLRRRVAEGRVCDCHGDLRSGAVCFDAAVPGGICLFDCIEFNERFRYIDAGLDTAFLAMDLDYRGRPDLSDLLTGLYAAAMGDKELPLLLRFFKCYRAFIRGKVESVLLDEAEVPLRQKAAARRRGKAYFRLAAAYTRGTARSGIVLVMGPSGSGKSVLASAVAARIGAVLLSTDVLRREGGRDAGVETGGGAVDAGRYAPEARAKVYEMMLRQAAAYAGQKRPIVLDGSYVERAQRASVVELAAGAGAPLLVVECVAPETVIRERQKRRLDEAWTVSEGRWEVYLAQRQRYEAPDEMMPAQRLQVDTARPLGEQIESVVEALRSMPPA